MEKQPKKPFVVESGKTEFQAGAKIEVFVELIAMGGRKNNVEKTGTVYVVEDLSAVFGDMIVVGNFP